MEIKRIHILVVEDDPTLRKLLQQNLRFEGYELSLAVHGEEALEKIQANNFDLILLDLMLPRMSGIEICKHLRQAGNQVPIIMLTAKDQPMDKVRGLKLGADDYLGKPFELMELLARIEAVLRRSGKNQAPLDRYQLGNMTLDFLTFSILSEGGKTDLSQQENRLLQYLVQHEGKVLSRDQILEEVWGHTYLFSNRTIDTHITKLRKKLEPDPAHPRHILTVHRVGYKFVGD
ncbi:MAG: response regulator transcription factor [Bacteroidota bacterium]